MAEKKQRFINKTARELRLLGEKGNKEALNELIIRGKKGDKCAMVEIVSIYEGLIHKYSTRFFINGYDVDDLKQIARSVIIESISKFDGDHGSEFIFFISTNVKNKLGTMCKKKENRLDFSSLDSPIGEGITIGETIKDDISIEDEYVEREKMRAFVKALANISKSDREFILYVYKDRGNFQKYCQEHKHITTYSKARWRKERILKKLREEMKNFE
ncbi:helix-turn-helix domain-containing protein [Clostridium perfringens]|uniref:helix-turn-helix domain-containing protein n=1 Tax=Clostridium perfringens TaxID=1502 RepID=UPI0024BD3F24|nr:helix-turn-helix domain-containing protein [Clostridium perfringens]